jgi:polyketide biosynthesis acyl carrier protein
VTQDEIVALIQRCARAVMPQLETHALRPGDSLQDLGANSMDRAEIVVMVLEEMALSIPRVQTFGPKNIGELAALLHEKQRPA